MIEENAEQLGYKATGTSDTKKQTLKMAHQLKETAKRDYKAEYKKFQSSTKSKKYRAELNQYNRKKGTYGNGDGKDASHKGGKIAGFEKESVNRGRAEKSRLNKEGFNLNKRYIDDDQVIELYRTQGNQAVIDLYTRGVDAVITSGELSEHILYILEIGLLTETDKWNKISELISEASIKQGFDRQYL